MFDAEFGGLAFGDAVFDATNRRERVEGDGVALHQRIEKMPKRREGLVLRGRGTSNLANIFTGPAGRDVAQFMIALVAPAQKPTDDPAVGTPGMFAADAGLEEFLAGEGGVWGPMQDRDRHGWHGQRWRGGARRNQFSGCGPARHLQDDNILYRLVKKWTAIARFAYTDCRGNLKERSR